MSFKSECSDDIIFLFKQTIFAFIRITERENIFMYPIPHGVMHLCFKYYFAPFVQLPDHIAATPFSILFVMFNYTLPSDEIWTSLTIIKQIECLQQNKIDTYSKRQNITDHLMQMLPEQFQRNSSLQKQFIHVIQSYYEEHQFLLSARPLSKWSCHDLILSFISYVIELFSNAETYAYNRKRATHPKIWQFVEYFRICWHDKKYDGNQFISFWSQSNPIPNRPTKWLGLRIMKAVCGCFQLKPGPFSKVKKLLNIWAEKLISEYKPNIFQLISAHSKQPQTSTYSTEYNTQHQHKPALKPRIAFSTYDNSVKVQVGKMVVYGFIRKIKKRSELPATILYNIFQVCFAFYYAQFNKLQNPSQATPFEILFAMFNCQYSLSIKGWESSNISQQCEILQQKDTTKFVSSEFNNICHIKR